MVSIYGSSWFSGSVICNGPRSRRLDRHTDFRGKASQPRAVPGG